MQIETHYIILLMQQYLHHIFASYPVRIKHAKSILEMSSISTHAESVSLS